MGPKLNYSTIEKTCLALIFSTKAKTLYAGIHGTLIAHAGSIQYMLSKLVLKR